jgi:hypothetical protein
VKLFKWAAKYPKKSPQKPLPKFREGGGVPLKKLDFGALTV